MLTYINKLAHIYIEIHNRPTNYDTVRYVMNTSGTNKCAANRSGSSVNRFFMAQTIV